MKTSTPKKNIEEGQEIIRKNVRYDENKSPKKYSTSRQERGRRGNEGRMNEITRRHRYPYKDSKYNLVEPERKSKDKVRKSPSCKEVIEQMEKESRTNGPTRNYRRSSPSTRKATDRKEKTLINQTEHKEREHGRNEEKRSYRNSSPSTTRRATDRRRNGHSSPSTTRRATDRRGSNQNSHTSIRRLVDRKENERMRRIEMEQWEEEMARNYRHSSPSTRGLVDRRENEMDRNYRHSSPSTRGLVDRREYGNRTNEMDRNRRNASPSARGPVDRREYGNRANDMDRNPHPNTRGPVNRRGNENRANEMARRDENPSPRTRTRDSKNRYASPREEVTEKGRKNKGPNETKRNRKGNEKNRSKENDDGLKMIMQNYREPGPSTRMLIDRREIEKKAKEMVRKRQGDPSRKDRDKKTNRRKRGGSDDAKLDMKESEKLLRVLMMRSPKWSSSSECIDSDDETSKLLR